MICIECDANVTDCTCPDIEDRLRHLIRTGNSLAQRWARDALYARLAKKKITSDQLTDEMLEVLKWSLNQAWAKHAQFN